MKILSKTALLSLIAGAILLLGCSAVPHEEAGQYKTETNYKIGAKMATNFGAPMIVKRRVYIYQNRAYPKDIEEILYSGLSGKTIKFMYRELYRTGYPSKFTQDLTYDLSKSDVVVFRNYNIKVIDANNTQIIFQVLKD